MAHKALSLVVLLVLATAVAVCGGEDESDDFKNGLNGTKAEDELAKISNNIFESDFETALANMSDFIPINVDYATGVGQECDIVKYNSSYYSTDDLIIAAIMVIVGIIFAFFGYRYISVVLFLIGFIVGGGAVYFIIVAFTYDIDEDWVFYVAASVALIVGLLCGLLTVCVYYIGIFLAGFCIGFFITWFLLGIIDVEFFQENVWFPIVAAFVVAVVVGIIALKILQKWFFILGTTILGSIMIIWGLDYYVELGAMMYYLFLFAKERDELDPCWYSWFVIPVLVMLLLAGFLVQALVTARGYDHKRDPKGICCGLCRKKKRKRKGEYMGLKDEAED